MSPEPRLTSQIRGAAQAIRNANDGISMLQTADSATGSMISLFQRMRELRVQYDSDTNNTDDKSYIESEITSAYSQILDIIKNLRWNDKPILNWKSDNSSINLQIGPNFMDRFSLNSPNYFSIVSTDTFHLSFSKSFSSIGNVFGLVSADMNNDRKIDLISVNDGSIAVDLGNGDGTFEPGITTSLNYNPNTTFSRQLTVGDFNGDHINDIAVIKINGSVDVLLGKGDGTFRSKIEIANHSGNQPASQSISSSDFNNDGRLDLAIGNSNSSDISVYFGNGDGTFAYQSDLSTQGAPFVKVD